MSDFIQRRQGAPFALVRNMALPAELAVSIAGVVTEIAPLGPVTSAVSGPSDIPIAAPAPAQQVLRWHFGPGERGGNSAATWIVDHGPDGRHGLGVHLSNPTPQNWALWSENTFDDAPTGAYGLNVSGGDAAAIRMRAQGLEKFHGQTEARILIGFFAMPWGTQGSGIVLTISGTLNLRRLPSNALRVTFRGQSHEFANIFADNTLSLLEVQIKDNRVTVYNRFQLVGSFWFDNMPEFQQTPDLHIGNLSSGGHAAQGWFNYLGVCVGPLSEGEIAWARAEAKAQIEARPGHLLALPEVPAPRPEDAPRFTALPETIPAEFQEFGTTVTLVSGRATDGLGGPMNFTSRVLFGPIAGQGAEMDFDGWSFLSPSAGYLTFEQTADNGVHPPVTATKILPIAEYFPPLNAAQIAQRLGAVVEYIDDFDAGFPVDLVWRRENVVDPGDGTVGLRILKNTGPGRPNTGASVQFRLKSQADPAVSVPGARLFSVDWTWQLIDTRGPNDTKGYMQTGFTFTVPWSAPRRELDFEYNSRSGLMECSIHLAANGGGPGSVANGIAIHPPADAFTGQRKWSIVSNADRLEWFYEDQLCARYIRGQGWDSSVQDFQPMRPISSGNYVPFAPGETYMHPRDTHWHLNPQNVFIQQWMTDTNPAWVGPNTVPIDHPLLRFSGVDAQEFGPVNTALQAGDWTVTAGGAGQAVIEVSNYRPNRFHPTHLEASVDGGAWQRLPGAFGPQALSGLSAGAHDIRLRPVAESLATDPAVTASTYVMTANASDTKSVTVT